jgi:hypothetical protein
MDMASTRQHVSLSLFYRNQLIGIQGILDTVSPQQHNNVCVVVVNIFLSNNPLNLIPSSNQKNIADLERCQGLPANNWMLGVVVAGR